MSGIGRFALVRPSGLLLSVHEYMVGAGIEDGQLDPNSGCTHRLCPEGVSLEDIAERYCYVNDTAGGWVDLGPRPSRYHFKNPGTRSWDEDLQLAQRERCAAVDTWLSRMVQAPLEMPGTLLDANRSARKRIASTLNRWLRRDGSPGEVPGAFFDADRSARDRIANTLTRLLRGDGLPAGWIGWRDAGNAMHWADSTAAGVTARLRGLATAIEDREQQLIVRAWEHKAAIQALGSVAAVLTYEIG